MAIKKVTGSVPQKGAGLVVEPSPLNHIKLELGLVLCVAALVLLLTPSLSADLFVQLAILLGFGVMASAWLVWRIRKTVAQLTEQANGENQ